ncbi:hypothetical protein IMSHALPRED_010207 [Imshaugia aleurites]|uniref:Uncharacterized protein n=1 Tax=Imshaugia aleurites TaxID=172621 RepID=A0A8H3IZJ8_9LECA|nr:hypothetical protein IMSHALPRED_010207 [Imshaugia aleurites]
MPQRSEIYGVKDDSMDSFEDVDLNSCDHATRNGPCDGQSASRPVNPPVDDAKSHNAESKVPRATKPRVPSEAAYQQAFLPSHTDTGTRYPSSQRDLDVHNTGAFRAPNPFPFVSAVEATREITLQDHVSRRVPRTELVAIDTLRSTVDAVQERMDFGPDLAIKAFADLDLVFFGARLKDQVRVEWVRASVHGRRFAARTRRRGRAMTLPEQGKCLIRLDADWLLRRTRDDDPLRVMFGTLLQEMCYAYEIVRCGGGRGRDKRRGYDEFFGTSIEVVHQRALRVLGLWACGMDDLCRQQDRFFPGEQTAAGRVVEWVFDVDDVLGEHMDAAAEAAARGVAVVKRWMTWWGNEGFGLEHGACWRGSDEWCRSGAEVLV